MKKNPNAARWRATYIKWFGKHPTDRWLTLSIILAMVIMFVAALTLSDANGHDIHFKDVNIQQPVVAQGWISGLGYIWATDNDGDGLPDEFWRLYKDGDLAHAGLHVEPLTPQTAARLFNK
jgi:hypothetical protein